MKFHVIVLKTSVNGHSPVQVVQQSTGKGVGWINCFLDREYVRRLSNQTLRSYAHALLHFVRWWESIHHTDDISLPDLTESTLLDYLRFQSSLKKRPSATTINDRVAIADRAIHNVFPDAPCQAARGFKQRYLHRRPMGLGRPRWRASGPASTPHATWPSSALCSCTGFAPPKCWRSSRRMCCSLKASSVYLARAAKCASFRWRPNRPS